MKEESAYNSNSNTSTIKNSEKNNNTIKIDNQMSDNGCKCSSKIKRLMMDNSLQNIEIIKLQTKLLKCHKALNRFVVSVDNLTLMIDKVVFQSSQIIKNVKKN